MEVTISAAASPPAQPLYLECLSTSPRIFRIHNFISEGEVGVPSAHFENSAFPVLEVSCARLSPCPARVRDRPPR